MGQAIKGLARHGDIARPKQSLHRPAIIVMLRSRDLIVKAKSGLVAFELEIDDPCDRIGAIDSRGTARDHIH